jgi:hypothetical protein
VRTPEQVAASGRARWTLPEHVRAVRKRVHTFLHCQCGRERRVLQYWVGPGGARKLPADAAQRKGWAGPFYSLSACNWADRHRSCLTVPSPPRVR